MEKYICNQIEILLNVLNDNAEREAYNSEKKKLQEDAYYCFLLTYWYQLKKIVKKKEKKNTDRYYDPEKKIWYQNAVFPH